MNLRKWCDWCSSHLVRFAWILLIVLITSVTCLLTFYLRQSLQKKQRATCFTDVGGASVILKGYADLLKDVTDPERIPRTPGGIPKLIFKTSWQKRSQFPPIMVTTLLVTMQLNPGYQVYYFDDDEMSAFMKNGSKSAFAAFNKLIPGAFKADLFRYCILRQYGGCYSDIGHVMNQSFDDVCGDNHMVLVKDIGQYGVHNALMCSIPNHDMIHLMIQNVVVNVDRAFYGDDSLDVTGPRLAGRCFITYTNTRKPLHNIQGPNQIPPNLDLGFIQTGTVNYDCTNCKIIMLQLVKNADGIHDIVNPDTGAVVLQTKFSNYYELMYSQNNPIQRYHDMWMNKNIYKK